jgi:hypothetical protein
MVSGRFVCLLKCGNCQESCAVSGDYGTNSYRDEQGDHDYDRRHPTSITPPPPMILLPEDYPKPIRQEVTAAFRLYRCDNGACLNRIRNALELVLDDLRIPKSRMDNNKKHRLNLHQRIEKLERRNAKFRDFCERMMAVNHLGNAGSHPGIIVKDDDVFDGFDMLEWVL